jgi:hypothetical protein
LVPVLIQDADVYDLYGKVATAADLLAHQIGGYPEKALS